jgi:hypothetical protein
MEGYKDEDKAKHLLEILKRIDTYILSTNQKSAIVISFCAALVGWLSININRFFADINSPFLLCIGALSILVLFVSSCYSIWLSVLVLLPITNSSDVRKAGDSVIFFGDIAASQWGGSGYVEKMKSMSQEDFVTDLIRQIHTVSTIADVKFKNIQKMTMILKCGWIVPLLVFLLVLLLNVLIARMTE